MFTKPIRGSTHDPSKTFTIIPFTVPVEETPPGYGGSQLVTEMWIERCIAANSMFNPSDLLICKPMPGPFPRPCIFRLCLLTNARSGERRDLDHRFLGT
jgi:hypothetical protein